MCHDLDLALLKPASLLPPSIPCSFLLTLPFTAEAEEALESALRSNDVSSPEEVSVC